MARIKKIRTICAVPRFHRFSPIDFTASETVRLTYDEYEVLRLHDLERLTQETIARQMQVSRPTVTEILTSAHQKVTDALTNGKQIILSQGECKVCEIGKNCPKATGKSCSKKHCCGATCRNTCFSESQ